MRVAVGGPGTGLVHEHRMTKSKHPRESTPMDDGREPQTHRDNAPRLLTLDGDRPSADQWQLRAAAWDRQHSGRMAWPEAASLNWGLPAATSAQDSWLQPVISLALDRELAHDPVQAASTFCEARPQRGEAITELLATIGWAYLLPRLARQLPSDLWQELHSRCRQMVQLASESPDAPGLSQWLGGCELAAALGRCGNALPDGKKSARTAGKRFNAWLGEEGDLAGLALAEGGAALWLVLASICRTLPLLRTAEVKIGKRTLRHVHDLATWGVGLLRPDGTTALQAAPAPSAELIAAIIDRLDDKDHSLRCGFALAIPRTAKRRHFTEAEYPPSAGWDEHMGLAFGRCDWSSRRGRFALHCQGFDTQLELGSGRDLVLRGAWQVSLTADGQPLRPTGTWEEVCWQSDDDVHYLEIEQDWSEGVKLQRQLLLIREDQCMMLSDAVITQRPVAVEYAASLPLGETLTATSDPEVREVMLTGREQRAVVMPLDLPEWNSQRAPGSFAVRDRQLQWQMRGQSGAVATLWLDLHRERFNQPRTWRQLTVGENLGLVARHEAVGYRIQVGSEQWVCYRSFTEPRLRTVLGRNLSYDFLCGRFDATDGTIDSLLEVESLEP